MISIRQVTIILIASFKHLTIAINLKVKSLRVISKIAVNLQYTKYSTVYDELILLQEHFHYDQLRKLELIEYRFDNFTGKQTFDGYVSKLCFKHDPRHHLVVACRSNPVDMGLDCCRLDNTYIAVDNRRQKCGTCVNFRVIFIH